MHFLGILPSRKFEGLSTFTSEIDRENSRSKSLNKWRKMLAYEMRNQIYIYTMTKYQGFLIRFIEKGTLWKPDQRAGRSGLHCINYWLRTWCNEKSLTARERTYIEQFFRKKISVLGYRIVPKLKAHKMHKNVKEGQNWDFEPRFQGNHSTYDQTFDVYSKNLIFSLDFMKKY